MRSPIDKSGRMALAALLLALAACGSSQDRGAQAYTEYQTAAAANDLPAARRALSEAVRADDRVALYWSELGRVQAALGSYGDAYYAFTRAYELDRANPDLLRVLTELALRSGNLELAERHARELEVLAPDDRWVSLTQGFKDFKEGRFSEALKLTDKLLSASPSDDQATGLRARALIGEKREQEAVDLLEARLKAGSADAGILLLLTSIYQRRMDWKNVTRTAEMLSGLNDADQNAALSAIEAAFRSGDIVKGRRASHRLLQQNLTVTTLNSVLDVWANYWVSPLRVNDAQFFAGKTKKEGEFLAYARFLNLVGSPDDALRLVEPRARLPLQPSNAEAQAIYGDSLARTGNITEGKRRLDEVLGLDPGHATALRARAELLLSIRQPSEAVLDAQKLVSVNPSSAPARLLLARCYTASGNQRQMERTLWEAFQQIPANELLYKSILATKRGDPEGGRRLNLEFTRQREAKLNRGLL
jgi:tetratricopeptide (TPR) repeat protein